MVFSFRKTGAEKESKLTFSWRDSFCDGHPKEWNNRSNWAGDESTSWHEAQRTRIVRHKGQNKNILSALLLYIWLDDAWQEDEPELRPEFLG